MACMRGLDPWVLLSMYQGKGEPDFWQSKDLITALEFRGWEHNTRNDMCAIMIKSIMGA